MPTGLPARPQLPGRTILALVCAILGIIIGTAYAVLGLLGTVPVTIPLFLTGMAVYFFTNLWLLGRLWLWRANLGFKLKIFLISWAGVVAWYTLSQAIFVTLTIHLDTLQLRWLNFLWMWELPAFGALMVGGLALLLAWPISKFVKDGKTALPGKLYRTVTQYPKRIGAAAIAVVLGAYLSGNWQLATFAHFPLDEQIKITLTGLATSIFFGIFYYLCYDLLLRSVRQRLETNHYVEHITHHHYAQRIFLITISIAFGSLLLVSMVVFHSYQQFIIDRLESEIAFIIQTDTQTLQADIATPDRYQADLTKTLTDLKQGHSGFASIITNAAALSSLQFSNETSQYIMDHPSGVVRDAHDTYKVIAFFSEPLHQQKIISVTQITDFYGPLDSAMRSFALAGGFVLLLTAIVSAFASANLSQSIRLLSQAVREAQRTKRDFTFDTSTSDELEDLAHAFRFYINQSNELQRDLERKVQERTTALVRIEEEKNLLEVKAAQQVITGEQQKRRVAEQMAAELEGRVKSRTAELEEAVHHLEELDAVKSEFISIASHQLRTPLTVIRWAYQSLLDGTAGPMNQDQVKMSTAGLQKALFMIRLVNNLLDITRIEGDRFTLEYTEFKLEGLVEQIVQDLRAVAQAKNVELVFNKLATEFPMAKLDQEKIQMSVSNLVDNAIKYTNGGGKVTVSIDLKGGVFIIKVSDSGIGIPKDQLYRLFTKFFRSSNAVSLHTDGSGLGLYIAKTIVEKHGGIISVDSEESKGTTFTINLPAIKSTPPPSANPPTPSKAPDTTTQKAS